MNLGSTQSASAPVSGVPPRLGQQVPGTTGGLPAQGGLSVLGNPMAQQLQSMGRGEDSMLVHMTPNEVNSLQGLAMASGGSLTINPNTGLPEAGWLGKLLPTILGVGLNFIPGVGPLMAAGLTAAGTTAVTGDLGKGLMAGLQAYGGASLSGAIAPAATGTATGAAAATNALPTGATNAGSLAPQAMQSMPQNLANISGAAQKAVAGAGLPTGAFNAAQSAIGTGVDLAGQGLASLPTNIGELAATGATQGAQAMAQPAGLLGKFGAAAKAGLPAGTPGIIRNAAPMLAGMGVMSGVSGAMTPGYKTADGKVDNSYQGPYYSQKRAPTFASSTADILGSSKERDYFNIDQPEIYNSMGQVVQPGSNTAPGTPIVRSLLNPAAKKNQPMYSFTTTPWMEEGYAKGGEVELADGAFVLDARTVSEIGNGSSNAGKEILRRIGGRPIEGPGDGVSDSVPARIGRDQPARVARDEVIIPADTVRRMGKGNPKRGADKLYALMDKAHKARKKAKRGQDTKLRRGLA